MEFDAKKILHKDFYTKVTSVDEEKFIIRGIFSTSSEDRHGEIVDQNGWRLDQFLLNPVILLSHNQQNFPVGKCIELAVTPNGLEGAIQFAVNENPEAKTAFELYKGGYMRAFSVGFMCNEYMFDENDQVILKDNTLFEISCVNVPANALALAYQKGIEIAPSFSAQHEKAGRMLSRKNENLIQQCIDVLTELLGTKAEDEDEEEPEEEPEEEKSLTSADTPVETKKVETPLGKGGAYRPRDINKAMRQLLEKKKFLEKSKK